MVNTFFNYAFTKRGQLHFLDFLERSFFFRRPGLLHLHPEHWQPEPLAEGLPLEFHLSPLGLIAAVTRMLGLNLGRQARALLDGVLAEPVR